eukprot:NODE_10455_length_1350_cov_9.210957.p1 GENE.NODE_10455_length_1350_cov_9.210957~~NODE_10455_length_1350_cov_9.210957.p1  ORF type:complete len:323 (-),score=74.16 NODE_10455_length_1350_cov_9.210957:236-1204(-)
MAGGPVGMENYPRELPAPEGCPEGWIFSEYMYKSGTSAGQLYTRYRHSTINDPKHKGITSILNVITVDAQDRGLNVEQELAKMHAIREEAAQRRAALRDEGKEEREYYGPLDGPTVKAFPGWKTDYEFKQSCMQTHVTYTDLHGTRWKLLKDLEHHFGQMIIDGKADEVNKIMGRDSSSSAAGVSAPPTKRRRNLAEDNSEEKGKAGSTDSETERVQASGDLHLGDGYKLQDIASGKNWVVLPDDVLEVDMAALGQRLAKTGMKSGSQTPRRHAFSGGLADISLYRSGRLLVRTSSRSIAHKVAVTFMGALNEADFELSLKS